MRPSHTTDSDLYCRMADFRLRTLEAIMLAFGRSKMRNSEEHSNSGSYLKRYLGLLLPGDTMGSPWLDCGTEDLPCELFISSSPGPSQVSPSLGDVVGRFLLYLSLEPFIYEWSENFSACTWYSFSKLYFFVRILFQYFCKLLVGEESI